MNFWTYILRCADGSLYVGQTDDIERRLSEHQLGLYDGYTKSRRPLKLAYCEEHISREDAFIRERQIKGWSRVKKEALIRGEWRSLVHYSVSLSKLRRLIIWDET
ncbi:MAG TPA: GIY-YIG nuclease family protein [Dehalococcoidia bacterium]